MAVLINEARLVVRAQAEPAAFDTIYDHYYSQVYNYVRYRVGNPHLTEDITAQIFERALVKLGSYQPEKAPFAAWLFGIARNAVRDHFRRSWRWLPLDWLTNQPSDAPSPEAQAAHQARKDQLLAAVLTLNDRERDAIALKYAADFTHQDIAHLMHLSESNVGVILFRAMRKLRTQLEDENDE